jgi:micrococcal nuclease
LKQEYIYKAKVLNIVDGDTIDVEIDLGFYMYFRTRLRLSGINTPELRDKDPIVRNLAQVAKQFLVMKILDKQVIIHSYKKDKYGRFLAEVYLGDENINTTLLIEGLAVPYG